MLGRPKRVFVEVSTIRQRGVIVFDFGHFAILEEYDKKGRWDNLVVYWKDQYNQFMKEICVLIDKRSTEAIEIDHWNFTEIQKICSKWRPLTAAKTEHQYFWHLMDKSFPYYSKGTIH